MYGLTKGIASRLRLLFFYFYKKDVHARLAFLKVLKATFAPRCETIAPRFSTAMRQDDKYIYYKIAGEEDFFSYPKELPYHNFTQIITEACQRDHFHYYEIPQTKIEQNDVVVDCGSAEGFFVYKYRQNCKHIYCIEPLPVFCRALHKLFDDCANVTIIEANEIPVEAITIDSLFADKGVTINFLKADLEGFEEKMILGALKTIQMFKPKIAITTYHPGTDYNKIIKIIRQVVPKYQFILKGVEELMGNPVILHMWVE